MGPCSTPRQLGVSVLKNAEVFPGNVDVVQIFLLWS